MTTPGPAGARQGPDQGTPDPAGGTRSFVSHRPGRAVWEPEEVSARLLDYAAAVESGILLSRSAGVVLRVAAGMALQARPEPAPAERPTGCAGCGRRLPGYRFGRPRRFCSDRCRRKVGGKSARRTVAA